jgi:hypothetical protein
LISRPILVLGAERSGVTLVSTLVARWGAYASGPAADPGGAPVATSPSGLTSEILAAAGGNLWSPALPDRLAALAEEPAWRERARALIASLADDSRPWLWTAPLPAQLAPFWEKLIPDPVVVIVVRNPLDSARSFARVRLPEDLTRLIRLTSYFSFRWQAANLTLLELSQRHPDPLFVDYEKILQSPVEQVRRLGGFLDIATGATGTTESCDERLFPMLEAVEPGLWHCRTGPQFFELKQVLEEQKELFRYLKRRAAPAGDTAEPFDPARFPIPYYAWEYLQNFEVYFTEQESALAAAG